MDKECVARRAVISGSLFSMPIIFLIVVMPIDVLAAETHEVEILRGSTTLADRSYAPNPVDIVKGDTIRFVNKDSVLHTATSSDGSAASPTPSGVFDTGYLGPNKALEVTINEVGEIQYYCQVHPTMVGLVRVSEGSSDDGKFTVTATHDGQSYEVAGNSSSSVIASQVTINANVSVVFKFDGSGDVELILPASMIKGIDSVTTSDGTPVQFTKTDESDLATTIKLTVPEGGDGSVVMMGASVVPEFSFAGAFLAAGSLAAIAVAVARISRSSIGRSQGM